MGDFKIKPPAPLIRSNTTHAGTLGFKRHHIPHHSPHHHHYHSNHDETSHSRVRVALEQEMDDSRDTLFSSTQPTSRKGSLQVEMLDRQERRSSLPTEQQIEVSTAVRNLQETSKQQMLRLATTYSSVSRKLNEIQLMSEQLKELGKAARDVLQEFEEGDMGCRKEFAAQIKGIERFQEELISIQKLQERLEAEKQKVQTYRKRLENVQGKIDKQKEMEIVWRQRASRRLRLLWGFISILVILWLLATASNEAEHSYGPSTESQVDQSSTPDTTFLFEGSFRWFDVCLFLYLTGACWNV